MWKNTRRYGLGVNYHANRAWTYRLGTAYDESPVRDDLRTPRIPDQDRTWLALGAQYRLSKTGTVDVGYAHLFVRDASINMTGAPSLTPAQALGRGSLVGTFESKVDILSVQYKHTF
jgi:long-chain fatty acid transport protein